MASSAENTGIRWENSPGLVGAHLAHRAVPADVGQNGREQGHVGDAEDIGEGELESADGREFPDVERGEDQQPDAGDGQENGQHRQARRDAPEHHRVYGPYEHGEQDP